MTVPGIICLPDAGFSENDTAGGEVRTFDVLHKVIDCAVGIVNHADNTVNDFTKIVRGNIGCHADCDTVGTIDKQVREPGR